MRVSYLFVVLMILFALFRKGEDFITFNFKAQHKFNLSGYSPYLVDSVLVSCFCYRESYLLRKSLSLTKVDTIRVNKKFYKYFPINDSQYVIFTHFEPDSFNMDTALQIINRKGKVIKYLNLSGSPFYISENKELPSYKLGYISNFFVSKGKVFLGIERNTGLYPLNSNLLVNSKIPLAAYIDLKTDTFVPLKIYDFPDLDTNYPNFASTRGKPYISLAKNANQIIIAFDYTPAIYLYDLKSDTYEVHRLKSFLVDTIDPTIEGFFPRYREVLYSEFFNLYFRVVDYSTAFKGLVIADTNFNVVGEAVLPKYFSIRMIDKNMLLGTDLKTKEVVGFEIEVVTTDEKEFIKKHRKIKDIVTNLLICPIDEGNIVISDKQILRYLEHFYNDDNYGVFILPLTNSCPYCVKNFLFIYMLNYNFFARNNIKVLFYGPYKSFVEDYLDAVLVIPKDYYQVDTLWYERYFGNLSNITFVKVENGKVKFKKNYQPKNLEEIYDDLLKYGRRED